MVVVIRKEVEHSSKELPGGTGTIRDERCMGVFHTMRMAQREVAAYLFDELSYHVAEGHGNATVGGSAAWKTAREDDKSVLELSIVNTDYTFTAYYVDDDEEGERGET